jgi:DMSO/TMAO reductase YedYZ molybdopterin-dependent catalytic subunit
MSDTERVVGLRQSVKQRRIEARLSEPAPTIVFGETRLWCGFLRKRWACRPLAATPGQGEKCSTILAYDMNDQPLTFGHGTPLRPRNEIELGFKQVKWLKGIEFVAHYSDVGGGYGGYDQDHEFFGCDNLSRDQNPSQLLKGLSNAPWMTS